MKNMAFIAWAIASMITAMGCINTPSTDSHSDASRAQDTLVNGIFSIGEQGMRFRPCGSNHWYAAVDMTDSLEGKYTELLMFRHDAEPVLLQATIRFRPESDTFFVKAMHQIGFLSFDAPCYRPSYIGTGNEPFWAIYICPELDLILMRDYSAMESHMYPYSDPVVTGKLTVYTSDSLRITLNEIPCSDGMSDVIYPFSCNVALGNLTLKGCAREK